MTNIEYVAISVAIGSVDSIRPESSETKVALEVGKKNSGAIGDVVNKLSESGWKLVSGCVPCGDVSTGGANFILFMQRERLE
jgi:hypothetical protein